MDETANATPDPNPNPNQNPPTLPALISAIEAHHPHTDPLSRLTAAVETAAVLTTLGDHLVGHFVDAARTAGASWAQIGVSLGVSKQAVQQRFVPREPATVADFSLEQQRFSHFTRRCLNCVEAAEKIARGTGAPAVTPTHILIGLFAEPESVAVKALAVRDAEDPARIRAAAVASLPPASGEEPAAADPLPFTPESRKVFDLAVRVALTLGHNYIGTEHLLLALVTDPASEPARLVAAEPFGLTREELEQEVRSQLEAVLRRLAEQRTESSS